MGGLECETVYYICTLIHDIHGMVAYLPTYLSISTLHSLPLVFPIFIYCRDDDDDGATKAKRYVCIYLDRRGGVGRYVGRVERDSISLCRNVFVVHI